MKPIKDTQAKELFGKLPYPIYNWEANASVLNYAREWKQIFYDYSLPDKSGDMDLQDSILKDVNKVIKFIVFAFDYRSGLVKEIADIMKRRNEACSWAGYDKNEDGKHLPHVQAMMELKIPYINTYIIKYLRHLKNYKFTLLITNEQQFYEAIGLRIKPIIEEDSEQALKALNLKSKAREECEKLEGKIEILKKEIFEDNDDLSELSDKLESELTSYRGVEQFTNINWSKKPDDYRNGNK
jgi:hypothetical protein